jgi:hypothetical protein
MMKRLGILERNEHRLPMMPATPELEKRLDEVLQRVGLLSGVMKLLSYKKDGQSSFGERSPAII